jgi:hypothetical protein
MFCQYRDVLGKPNEGIHATRIPIIDVALWDLVGMIILIVILSHYISTWSAILVVSLGTIFLHYLFCVNTRVNTMLFGMQ